MYEKELNFISKYIDDRFYLPNLRFPREYFIKQSYSRWAGNEILQRIFLETEKPPTHITGVFPKTPLEIVQEFIEDMEFCICSRTNHDHDYIFKIAKTAAEEIMYTCL